jgi:hypothetical protein
MRFQFYNVAVHHAEYQFSVFVLHQGMLLNRVLTRKRQSGAVQAVKAETSKCYKKNVIVTYCACFYEKSRCYFTKGSGTKLTEAIIFRLLEKIRRLRRWDRFLFTVLDEVQFLLQIGVFSQNSLDLTCPGMACSCYAKHGKLFKNMARHCLVDR